MTNYSVGHDAEKTAADYLRQKGYKIIGLNWRTRYCEIDVVAEKAGTVYMVEVKYRKSKAYGSGLEYVTAKKLQQMKFAAEIWVSHNKWEGNYQLMAIGIDGSDISLVYID
ncbi:MAG TPA: YraN family protein [Candidatus Limnocylindrales bacterium]|nr:YraN family protein [Candidatus Limnocylindrales bacterium]